MPPQHAGMGALKWERRPFHLPAFSLSAPLLARILAREWEEKEERREHPTGEADRDGTMSIVVRTRECHRAEKEGKRCVHGNF